MAKQSLQSTDKALKTKENTNIDSPDLSNNKNLEILKTRFPVGKLDDLAKEHNTDKSSEHHDYTRLYEFMLAPLRYETFTLLELGVGIPSKEAPSLRVWRDYFPNAQIVGVDIRKISKNFEGDRIAIEIGDASDPKFLTAVYEKYKPHVVIDDASHFWSHQIIGLRTLLPLLPPGGIYFIEDLQTSFWENSEYSDAPEDCVSFMLRLMEDVMGNHKGRNISSEEEFNLTSYIDNFFVTRKLIGLNKRSTPHPRAQRAARKLNKSNEA
ncbi:hypothetical protein [Roseovarius sp. EL26]|uniref:hypothetical protein n=1 Tax=Roseovarius sp. EL26 TaxID=2126672 RepID=UPI000EA1FCBC|nr:hypothetical protein [Roseovarius sp. EL26]